MKNQAEKKNPYDMITDQIIAKLEEGEIPWNKPWVSAGASRNLVSKKAYRGINILLLSMTGFDSPYWMTFKQAKSLGGSVRKGAKGTTIVFWKILKREDEDGKEQTIPFLRTYNVFNLEQCQDIDESKIPQANKEPLDFNPIEACENIVKQWFSCPEIRHGGNGASYRPSLDYITMPNKENFKSETGYYASLFHEMVHSTGHESRLNRPELMRVVSFGSEDYSKEELVAEMGASFLCGAAGIQKETIGNATAYIQSWLSKLKDDNKLIVHASGQAQRAVDSILGTTFEEVKEAA